MAVVYSYIVERLTTQMCGIQQKTIGVATSFSNGKDIIMEDARLNFNQGIAGIDIKGSCTKEYAVMNTKTGAIDKCNRYKVTKIKMNQLRKC